MDYIKKIMNMMNKNGKKTLAIKAVNRSLQKIRKYIPPSRLDSVFEPLLPAVKIYKKKVAGKIYQIPARITTARAVFQTASWVYTALVTETRKRKSSLKLTKLLLETARYRGNVWKLRKQYLLLVKENRSYMRFIRKKRKKKKVWIEKQRFTKRVSIKETRKKRYKLRDDKFNVKTKNKKAFAQPRTFNIKLKKSYDKNKKINTKYKK